MFLNSNLPCIYSTFLFVLIIGQITSEQSLFTYKSGESVDTFRNDSYVPMFLDAIKWSNESLRLAAEAQCNGDVSCLFDAAATNDLSIGAATMKVNVQLVKESKELGNLFGMCIYCI